MKIENFQDRHFCDNKLKQDIIQNDEEIISSQTENKSSQKTQSQTWNSKQWSLAGIIITTGVIIVLLFYIILFPDQKSLEIDNLMIPQSFVEDNEVKSFRLDNNLKVVIVKPNQGYKNSFVALSVGVGSQSDPKDFIGFTHLIEHLLFTGSKKYPEDNYIEKVVNKYQGENNGVTKAFTTSYYYSLEGEGLEEFSDVLADALANPLFAQQTIEKELNNVNSEISMRMTFNKNLGIYKMIKKIGNLNSRMFSDGFANIDPKSIDFQDLRKRIVEFHKKYYSANIMTLAIISDEDSEKIENIVREKFSEIPDKNIKRNIFDSVQYKIPPISEDVLGNVFYLQSFSPPANLSLVFPLKSFKKNKFNPLEFFSIYLNDESENSFKRQLIQKGYILEMGDELVLEDFNFSIYRIEFELTQKGQKNISSIIKRFYQFISQIKDLPDKDKYFDQLAQISKFNFLFNFSSEFLTFSSKVTDPFERALLFSEILQDKSEKDIFIYDNLFEGFNSNDLNHSLKEINPDNCLTVIQSQNFEISKKIDKKKFKPKKKTFKKYSERRLKLLLKKTKKKNVDMLTNDDLFKVYFDNAIDEIELDKQFDFDNERKYSYQRIPQKIIDYYSNISEQKFDNFFILNNLDTSQLTSYDIITQCKAPSSLALDNQQEIPKLSIDKLNDLILNQNQKNIKNQISQLKDLTVYKFCLIEEFKDDDADDQTTVLHESSQIDIYHKLFRKSLEPEYTVILELESQYLIKELLNEKEDQRYYMIFLQQMLCYYLKFHMKQKYHSEFMKGNDFDCSIQNYHFIFQFSGITKSLNTFIEILLNHFKTLKDPDVYNEVIIDNLKKRMYNQYESFDSMTSLNLSQYYLKQTMDKLFIDYSNPNATQNIHDIIFKINAIDMSDLMSEILQNNKLSVIFIGNVDQKNSRENGLNYQKYLNQTNQQNFKLKEYRKQITENLLLQIKPNEHLMARSININPQETNNVYLTYFKMGILTKKQKVLGLTLESYISKTIFDEMRNKRNLGYVAHAGLKVFYHNLGLIILIQGENFRPNTIESIVDEVLMKFIEDLKKKSPKEIKKLIVQNIADILQFPDTLDDVASKIFYHLEEQKVNLDSTSYLDLLKEFDSDDLYKFAHDNLVKNQARVTIELFAKDIKENEAAYEMPEAFALNQKAYQIVDFNDLINMKFMSKQF